MTSHLRLRWHSDPLNPAGLVVATGVFDLLHVGHLALLNEAHRRGYRLAVGVEDDERVRAWKGPRRPINSAFDRAELLAALKPVDGVFVISGDPAMTDGQHYVELLRPLKPHALVFTSGDPHSGAKYESARNLHAHVWEVQHVGGYSSTEILHRLD